MAASGVDLLISGQHRLSAGPFALWMWSVVMTVLLVLVAVRATVHLLLPALILTPDGLVTHTIVYHVAIPWTEIEQKV